MIPNQRYLFIVNKNSIISSFRANYLKLENNMIFFEYYEDEHNTFDHCIQMKWIIPFSWIIKYIELKSILSNILLPEILNLIDNYI